MAEIPSEILNLIYDFIWIKKNNLYLFFIQYNIKMLILSNGFTYLNLSKLLYVALAIKQQISKKSIFVLL